MSTRPHIPLRVRVIVAERQFIHFGASPIAHHDYLRFVQDGQSDGARLEWLLKYMGMEGADLDHRPPLALREQRNGRYFPDANDPHFLEYLSRPAHLQRTTGRAPGAAVTVTTKGSDAHEIAKQRRRGKPPKRKTKIASRKTRWPKRRFGQ